MKEIVFISYTRSDSEIAVTLANSLQNEFEDIDVWIDSNEIGIRNNIDKEIAIGLNKSTSMILLLSETSFNSKFIRKEFEYAIFNNKLENRILPVFLIDKDKNEEEKIPWIFKKYNLLVIDRSIERKSIVNKIIKNYIQIIRGGK